MNPNEYQKLAARTLLSAPDAQYTPEQIMLVWNAIGFAGEAGEVAELVKKGVFHQHGIDRAKLINELGDALWYLAGICTTSGISLEYVMAENISKLQARYPNGYSSERSINRLPEKST